MPGQRHGCEQRERVARVWRHGPCCMSAKHSSKAVMSHAAARSRLHPSGVKRRGGGGPMKIAVAGGAGVAGRWTAEALRAGGHEVIVIARSAGIDLVTGDGLEAALAGADAVIDATNVKSSGKRASSAFFEATARTLTRTAPAAGGGALVCALDHRDRPGVVRLLPGQAAPGAGPARVAGAGEHPARGAVP